MRPFDTYTGGKGASGVHQKIINQIRPHDEYYEPFVGNGYIFSMKRRSATTILNDMSRNVANRWKAMNLPGVEVKQKCGIVLLEELRLSENRRVVYCDPPYPIESRSQQKEYYEHDWTDEDHLWFLEVIRQVPCDVLVSTYPNDMYESHLGKWRNITFQAKTRGGVATEVLYMNYKEPTSLHDYSYLGEDYRERENIKKVTKRTVSKINKLDPLVRNNIIELLNQ